METDGYDPYDVTYKEVYGDEEPQTERAQRMREHAKEAARKHAIIDAYGVDGWPENTVIRFFKKFSEGSDLYPYVAIKAGGMWYVGGQAEPFFWTEFIEFIELDNQLGADSIFVATKYDQIYEVG